MASEWAAKNRGLDMYISIIVTLYKGKKYIADIMGMLERNRSELSKSGLDTELQAIFVNDYPSEDIRLEEIEKKRIEITLFSNKKNMGIHYSRAVGLEGAKGDYILFLDQDDKISDNYFASQLSNIDGKDAVLCNGIFRHNKQIYSDRLSQERATKLKYYLQLKDFIVSPGQVLLKRSAIPEEWKFNILHYNGYDDNILWILVMKNQYKFSINENILYWHIEDGNNASLNYRRMIESLDEFICSMKKMQVLSENDMRTLELGISMRRKKYSDYIALQENWDDMFDRMKEICQTEPNPGIYIYGYGVIGRRLYQELIQCGIEVNGIFDKDAVAYQGEDIKRLDEELQLDENDVIFVTATFDFERIKEEIFSYHKCQIFSILDMVNNDKVQN